MRFLLVDRILELQSGSAATGLKNITLSEDFLADHFPDFPVMPGTLIAEALVQLADWVIRESTQFQQMGMVVAFEQMKFRQMVRPGDQLRLEVRIVARDEAQVQVRGKAFCADALVATTHFTLELQALEPLQSAADARQLYQVLAGSGTRMSHDQSSPP